ncbi:hypothetical protein Zmor_002329 [Zophobas morio]|uniref:Uncharacterized protein n=1 Tax=Zophobas morio TaxID=2755281 RepID=A0AA38MTQ3_9CUCU|nr:hypothetical protein Zmor_002329 [Zophobas morio]
MNPETQNLFRPEHLHASHRCHQRRSSRIPEYLIIAEKSSEEPIRVPLIEICKIASIMYEIEERNWTTRRAAAASSGAAHLRLFHLQRQVFGEMRCSLKI